MSHLSLNPEPSIGYKHVGLFNERRYGHTVQNITDLLTLGISLVLITSVGNLLMSVGMSLTFHTFVCVCVSCLVVYVCVCVCVCVLVA